MKNSLVYYAQVMPGISANSVSKTHLGAKETGVSLWEVLLLKGETEKVWAHGEHSWNFRDFRPCERPLHVPCRACGPGVCPRVKLKHTCQSQKWPPDARVRTELSTFGTRDLEKTYHAKICLF